MTHDPVVSGAEHDPGIPGFLALAVCLIEVLAEVPAAPVRSLFRKKSGSGKVRTRFFYLTSWPPRSLKIGFRIMVDRRPRLSLVETAEGGCATIKKQIHFSD